MLKKVFAEAAVHLFRILFTGAFAAINLAGIGFLGLLGYYLIF